MKGRGGRREAGRERGVGEEERKKAGSPLTGAGKSGEEITVVSAGLSEDGH